MANYLLAAHMILCRAVEFDYPFVEAVRSVLPIADEVHLLVHPTGDGTLERAAALTLEYPEQVTVHVRPWWDPARRCDALSDATNYCIEQCRCKYHLALQADEVLHESQAPALLRLCEQDVLWAEFGRLNFHGRFDAYNANPDRWPTSVVRLAQKRFYPRLRSYGDATHLGWLEHWDENRFPRTDARDHVQFWHYAYTRAGRPFVERQASMAALYGLPPDPAIEASRASRRVDWKGLVPEAEFRPLPRPHPAVMREWVEARRAAVEAGAWELS